MNRALLMLLLCTACDDFGALAMLARNRQMKDAGVALDSGTGGGSTAMDAGRTDGGSAVRCGSADSPVEIALKLEWARSVPEAESVPLPGFVVANGNGRVVRIGAGRQRNGGLSVGRAFEYDTARGDLVDRDGKTTDNRNDFGGLDNPECGGYCLKLNGLIDNVQEDREKNAFLYSTARLKSDRVPYEKNEQVAAVNAVGSASFGRLGMMSPLESLGSVVVDGGVPLAFGQLRQNGQQALVVAVDSPSSTVLRADFTEGQITASMETDCAPQVSASTVSGDSFHFVASCGKLAPLPTLISVSLDASMNRKIAATKINKESFDAVLLAPSPNEGQFFAAVRQAQSARWELSVGKRTAALTFGSSTILAEPPLTVVALTPAPSGLLVVLSTAGIPPGSDFQIGRVKLRVPASRLVVAAVDEQLKLRWIAPVEGEFPLDSHSATAADGKLFLEARCQEPRQNETNDSLDPFRICDANRSNSVLSLVAATGCSL